LSDIGSNYGHNSVVILLDESGDMGRSPGSSRHFVVAAMAVHDPNELVRLLKNARRKLTKKDWKGERKFNNTTDSTRTLILEGVANLDCQIAWISFEKDRLPSAMLTNKHLLYQTACEIVLPELFRRVPARRMHIIMDKYYSKKWERDRLDKQVRSMLIEHHAGNFVPQVQMSQFDSILKKELQVHDFVVGAVYQYVERDVDTYIRRIESKIVFGQER
jgi:hypothetical protein